MQDKDHLILTAIGPDQVGLVARISQFISRHGCNIEDSKMAVFCGEFAVIILIGGDAQNLADIARMLGTTRSTVAVSLFRSRARLKKRLLKARKGANHAA